ncbi:MULTISPECIES: hypothetical protein [Rhizobium]|uniref:hypothetical protein n=1 Tax=Rhizobium TaxID=379 RepID=UPI0011062308|nr:MULTISPECIES: hypothetical protein [Rhizobium]MBY3594485.1 hypothetical protein [Rhizobium bangladeshense]TLX13843.1 hypothetical protein FFR93_08485 [Rhizobium sp. MHM7A]
MEDWFNYLMSCFYMAFQNAVFFMATVQNGVSRLDDRQFAALALSIVGIILILFVALVRTSSRLRRSTGVVRSLSDELAQATQDLNVERLWRLAGGDGAERPAADSLTELYRILSRHNADESRIA